MTKYFCDHCGKEIPQRDVFELDADDCLYSHSENEFVGCGCMLCEDCWSERHWKHIELDRKFLHLEDKKDGNN